MPRILGIDYGLKRVGLAVTDPLQISVNGLVTIPSEQLQDFLISYLGKEEVEKIVVGDPFPEEIYDDKLAQALDELITFIRKEFPGIVLARQDESYSSVKARDLILQSGARKKKRRDKSLVDRISAVLILQQYLNHI